MSDRREFTVYVAPRNDDSPQYCIVLSGLDNSRSGDIGYFYSFVGTRETVNVVSQHEKITREKALEIAARYVAGKAHITRIEFPETDLKLQRIIRLERKRKNKRFGYR